MKKSFTTNLHFLRTFWIVILLTVFTISCSQNMIVSGSDEAGPAGTDNSLSAGAITYSSVNGENKPYPQHVTYKGSNFTKPSYTQTQIDTDVANFFRQWRQTYIVPYTFTNGYRDGNGSGYIIKADANGIIEGWGSVKPASQSEATGYAMIVFALMSNQDPKSREIFDGMFTIYRNFPCKDNVNLMSWAIPEGGDFSLPKLASATDGDMDIAYALLLADKQWGSGGTYNYYAEAKKIIAALEVNAIFETGPNSYYPRLNIGDNDDSHNYGRYKVTRSSDWILTHTEAFYQVSGNQVWKDLQNVMIKIANDQRNPTTGLVADFYGDRNGVLATFEGISDESGGKYDNDYYYNSCRFPWRMAMGYAHLNLEQPRQFSESITSWLVGKFTVNGNFDSTLITAGYELNGTHLEPGQDTWLTWTSDAFNGSFMAGMSVSGSQYQSQLTKMWDDVKEFEGIASMNNYYDDTLSLLSLLFVSGNWWHPDSSNVPTPPSAPANVSAVVDSTTQVSLDWNDNPESDIKEYNVYRKLSTAQQYTKIATVTVSAYTNTGLTENTTYQYVVTAVNQDNLESENSVPVTVTTTGMVEVPVPTNLTAQVNGSSVTLTWNASAGAVSYKVYQDGQQIATTTSTTYTVTGLADGSYSFSVSAIDAAGNESEKSAPQTALISTTEQEVTVTIKKTGGWGNTIQGEIIIENKSSSTVAAWDLVADFDFSITSHWCGTITSSGSTYTVLPAGWNANLAPGAKAAVGFMATGSLTGQSVTNAKLNGQTTTVIIIE